MADQATWLLRGLHLSAVPVKQTGLFWSLPPRNREVMRSQSSRDKGRSDDDY